MTATFEVNHDSVRADLHRATLPCGCRGEWEMDRSKAVQSALKACAMQGPHRHCPVLEGRICTSPECKPACVRVRFDRTGGSESFAVTSWAMSVGEYLNHQAFLLAGESRLAPTWRKRHRARRDLAALRRILAKR